VVSFTNATFRVMAANLNGNTQSYQPFALRILQGLKPDVVAIQEFNYGNNTAADFRAMLDATLGTNYVYFRESGSGYSIPNGILSRYPIRAAGTWDDLEIPDRGFAWAQLALPGANDLYVVSVHLKSDGSSATRRANEANSLSALIAANFPAGAWIVVAGDCNTSTRSEAALTTFKTFLSDHPIPADAETGGNSNTSEPRSKPYDYVLPSFSLGSNQTATVIGARRFPNGLVFDSLVYAPLSDVAPVQAGDSHQAQHMAVVKDFQARYPVTNWVSVPAPLLTISAANGLRWTGPSNLTYTVETTADLTIWLATGAAGSSTTNYSYTNRPAGSGPSFQRVRYP